MFTEAIVRAVPETIHAGITSASLGKPDYEKACEQHDRYVGALERCGLEVTVLGADERYPDSVFVEDTAIVTDRCAIIANPGSERRRGEVHEVEEVLSGLYENVERIVSPGTLDGGDVLQVGDHVLVARGCEKTKGKIAERGYEVIELEMSEFRKVDGGLSCLSLRLEGGEP